MDNIGELLALPEDKLLQLMGALRTTRGNVPSLTVDEHLRMAGFLWFRQIWEELYDCICREWKYCEKHLEVQQQSPAEQVRMVAAVIEQALTNTEVPPAVVATILVKRGVERFCDCERISSLMERRDQAKRYMALPKTVNLDLFFVPPETSAE